MLPPMQRPRNFNPRQMNNMPNQFMFPNRGFNGRGPGGNKIQNMLQQFTQPNSAANIAGRSAGGLSKTLTNVQQVLKMVQSTAPIVQEYGPMVKNLPAMYRMMKAFKEIENTDEDNVKDVDKEINESPESENNSIQKSAPSSSGESKPKLFI